MTQGHSLHTASVAALEVGYIPTLCHDQVHLLLSQQLACSALTTSLVQLLP